MRHYLWVIALLMALPITFSAFAETPQCSLTRVTELQVDISHGELLVQVQVDGHDARMVFDTASPFSGISARLANTLKLPFLTTGEGIVDASNRQLRHAVKIQQLRLGNIAIDASGAHLLVWDEGNADDLADGNLGADILINYDIEFDLKHGKIYLYKPDHCRGQVVYWTQDYMSVPFNLDASQHIVFDTILDGHSLRTTLDTGLTISTLSTQIARKVFDLDPAAEGATPDGQMSTNSGASIPYYKHRFGKLSIAGIDFQNTEIVLVPNKVGQLERARRNAVLDYVPSQINQDTPLVIGLRHLAKLRAFVAYRERNLYISAADAN
jgi:hypothetical protein